MGRFAVMAQSRWIAVISFLFLLAVFHLIFGQFFPTRNGTLGTDYVRVLPDLLDGYFWLKSNGLFEPFWFTPSFCGGQPELADQGSVFYSVAQFLTFFINPLTGVYVTVLLFAALGFWGFYLLLRSCFGAGLHAAVLGGALFMFNGFFTQRMIIGHYMFHGVMLTPWIAYFLLRPVEKRWTNILRNGAVAGCMLAYGACSGLSTMLLPCAVAVLAIICIHRLIGREPADFVRRSLVAALVAIGLSAAKLVATFSFLQNFPRNDYVLPGFANPWDAIQLLFSALFFAPSDIAEQAWLMVTNAHWQLERQEWEYGVTVVPLLIMLFGIAAMLRHKQDMRPQMCLTRWAWLALLGFVLALPLALNIYTPGWNVFLKQIPVIKSSSNLLRWFMVYIPVVILIAALFLDRISWLSSRRNGMLMVALAALILINAGKDRDFYHAQKYMPDTIVNAWHAVHTGTRRPRIQFIGSSADANDRDDKVQRPVYGNDLLTVGESQFSCYQAVFGYRLEHFPVKTLHEGSVLNEKDGLLNIKNPACYLYPKQNNCSPGDHFTVAQYEAAQAFANYKPFPFSFSAWQQIANRVTQATLVLLAVLIAVALSKRILRRG